MDVSNEGAVKKRFGFLPELIAGFSVALGVGNEARHQLQNVLFRVNIGKWIVVHRLFEVDRIEDFNAVAKSPEHLAALDHNAALGVCDNKGTGIFFRIALHEIRFQPEARLAAAGAADHQHVFIARCFRVFRAVVHRQFLRLRQNDIVSGVRVNVGRNVLMRSP